MSLVKKALFSVTVLFSFILALTCLEFFVRQIPKSPPFARFLFFTEFKVDRWRYLSKAQNLHQLDIVMESHPNAVYIEHPEEDRPPFDQVPSSFEVRNNQLGFRDTEFLINPQKSRIMLLGDSIAFGKGVSVEERFSSLVQKELQHTQIFNLGLQGCTAECMSLLFEKYVDELQPDMLLIQASGNDLDQALWQQAKSSAFSNLRIQMVQVLKNIFFIQKILSWSSGDHIGTQMQMANNIVLDTQGPYIKKMYAEAQKRGIDILILNLPYAYNYHYGSHMTDLCTYDDVCLPEIRLEWPTAETLQLQSHSKKTIPPIRPDFLSRIHKKQIDIR